MKCDKCGTDNNNGNKFCTNCGEELPSEIQLQKNICESCGSENELTSNYCVACGEKMKAPHNVINEHAKHTYQHKQKSNKWENKNESHSSPVKNKKRSQSTIGRKPLIVAIGVLVISLASVAVLNKWLTKGEKNIYPAESKSLNPVVETKALEIASKFVCSCGSCGEQSLESCKCARAIEERQFVRDYLERKAKPEDIVVALANRYGFLKAGYAKTYKINGSKTWTATTLQDAPNSLDLIKPNSLNTGATFANVSEIYSAFKCPCGQCGIDELKNCDCPHKNGAQEIKAFVGNLIKSGTYTVGDIINIVNEKYGGKKPSSI